MSGQTGCYYFDRRQVDQALAKTLDLDLRQQGPDQGSHFDEPGLLMIYRARHFDSISELERQPYVSPKGPVVTFDGRLDNRSDLLIRLRDELNGEITDVALAGAAYVRWSEQCFERLIGDWSLTIWDPRADCLLLASDYCGAVPLYYSFEPDQGIRWSSSLQSLADWSCSVGDLDESWICAFLTGRDKFDHTVYRRIRSVPSAHTVCVCRGKLTITRFWKPRLHDVIHYRDERQYQEELLHHFREAVAVRLRSNRPVACDLTGGLDSSSVTCMAHALVTSGAVEANRVIAFTELDHCTEDEGYASIVKQHLAIEQLCCDMQSTWAQGVQQPSPSKAFWRRQTRAKRLLEEGVRVNLTGEGGDFIMGNDVDDCAQVADGLARWEFRRVLAGIYAWSRALRVPVYEVFRRSIVPLLAPTAQRTAWKELALREANLYRHIGGYSGCFTPHVLNLSNENLGEEFSICPWFEARPGMRKFFLTLELSLVLNRGWETMIDLEPIRLTHPYLHRPLVDYICSIPRGQLCGPGTPRLLMRHAFSDLLPTAVVDRKTKASMNYQYYTEARELLSHLPPEPGRWESVKRGWVEKAALASALEGVSKGTLHEWSEIKKIFVLETWLSGQTAKEVPSNYTADSQKDCLEVRQGR